MQIGAFGKMRQKGAERLRSLLQISLVSLLGAEFVLRLCRGCFVLTVGR